MYLVLFLIVQQLLNVVLCGNLFIIPTPIPTSDSSNRITASIDESFVISCVSSGTNEDKPKALEWKSPSGQQITSDTNQRMYVLNNGDTLRLYFDKLKPTDTGVYTCEGTIAGVRQEVKVELQLQKKISFSDTAPEQFIKSNQDQTIFCHATANPGPEIAWFRKGINIELKNDDKYQITNDGLMIKNVQPEDEGVYYCQASVTDTGEVKRTEIAVQVMSPPKWIVEPKDTEGVNGQDVTIKCEAFAKPAPVYSWTRNGIPLVGTRYVINANNGGTLTIRNLVKEDTATYSCVAENNSGRIEAVLRLAVLIAPEVAIMNDAHAIEGSEAVLTCNVREAYPKAEIKWKYSDTQEFIDETTNPHVKIIHDGNVQDDNSQSLSSFSELKFEKTTRFDKRNYTCVATNKAAVAERQAQLLVEYMPKLLIDSEAREVYYSWITVDEYGNSGNVASQSTRAYPVVFTCKADGEPKPLITWYFKGELIKVDNIKYRLLKDQEGMAQLEVNPRTLEDFGDYQCRAENRLGKEERNLQIRQATSPKFAPQIKLKSVNPEVIYVDLIGSNAPDADGGMPIESYKIQWRFAQSDWSKPFEKEVQVISPLSQVFNSINSNNEDDLNKVNGRDVYDVEIGSLVPDTEYLFRVAAVNKPGVGEWTKNEVKLKTSPRRQPDPVKIISKEDCQASSRCYIEWTVDSNGGSPIREYLIRWRRIAYKDSLNQHLNTDKVEPWSSTRIVKAPTTNYEILQLASNSFYEIDVLARNDIGPSASQPFRIRTLPGPIGDTEAFEKKNASKINKGIIIAGSLLGALVLFIIIDVICLMKSNCGLLALITKSCNDKNKSNSSDYITKSPPPKIAQHQPKQSSNVQKPSKTQYQPINQVDDTSVKIPMNE